MMKQEIQFAVAKTEKAVRIGRSSITQPAIRYTGNGIKWFDDRKLIKSKK